MSRFFNTLAAIVLIALYSSSPVFSTEIEENNDKDITGILVRVDAKNQVVYVKENSRIVKFKASAVLCEKFKDKINLEVDITYEIGKNKSLRIVTMVMAEKKEESKKVPVKSKVVVKGKSKK